MTRFLKVAVILFFGFFISCKKDDDVTITPANPFVEQYPVDLAKIEKFFVDYHMDVTPGTYDVTFTKIPNPNTGGLVSIKDQYITPNPNPYKTVTRDGIDYKIYYISLREGVTDRPTPVDSIFTSYRGRLLDNTSFDQTQDPLWFPLESVVTGWSEILPLFKSGTYTVNGNGSVNYDNYGAGVMFLPSAFGYYNAVKGVIPAYSPLIFNFKLNTVNYVDHDYDRVESRYEDINGNGNLKDDDTDGDGKPNYLDTDDDGDGYATKFEIKNPAGGYFDFANIPICTADGNKKVHLTKTCKPTN
ncbi:FKBP-type peptidyl-prolyl cis-trans isomerase [Flavobacterium sp.]|uniref:FKBP-type peptidyl-prolyl cis-trans isomerase n=1 Tax=Flavobacterium sp. TaxID=239 RepID=UPI003D6A00EF